MERQSASSWRACGLCVVAHVLTLVVGGFVVSCYLTSALLLERYRVRCRRSRDSTYSIHGLQFVKSANSFTFNLSERSWAFVFDGLTGQHLGLVRPHSRRSSRCNMPSFCHRHSAPSWAKSTTHRSPRLTRTARLTRIARLEEPLVRRIRDLLRFICGQLLLGCQIALVLNEKLVDTVFFDMRHLCTVQCEM